jgi:ankyrin repeat protein
MYRWTQLFQAAADDNVARVREAVARGVDVNERDAVGVTALHVAAHHGHVEVARTLIDALRADKEAHSVGGMRPLHVAALFGHVEVARLLISRGADKEARTQALGESGMRPLHMAAYHGQVEVARLLISKGADKEAQDAAGWTPLRWAAASGHLEMVRALVQLGAELGAQTDGDTAHALSLKRGHQHVAQFLEAAAQSQSAAAATATATQTGVCAACGVSSSSGAHFKKCSRCKAVRYCSKDCQLTHWPVHKASCAER